MLQPGAKSPSHHFFPFDRQGMLDRLGKDRLVSMLRSMLLIRNFEVRAESAYQQGKVGGFFHAYIGQEAIQTAALEIFGPNHWYITSYRCHALALLLGATPQELMAELYGRANGNAKGRGGSMHFYTDRLLGGFGIVTGQMPIAAGAAFAIKYRGIQGEIALCFLGDGAVAQGAFHEALNLASLWNLPCLYVIENNQWGMGTHFSKAICVPRLAEDKASGYAMQGYSVDGTDVMACCAVFDHIYKQMLLDSRPVLLEAVVERFRGHSISDPGLYRTKDSLKESMERDPLTLLKRDLLAAGVLNLEGYKKIDDEMRAIVVEAMRYAEESPWPDPATLEEDVFAAESDGGGR